MGTLMHTVSKTMTITALSITVFSLAIMIAFTLKEAMNTVYKDADVIIDIYDDSGDFENFLIENNNIEMVTLQNRKYCTMGQDEVILSGVDPQTYILSEYENFDIGKREAAINGLKNEGTVIVSANVAERNGFHEGDYIEIYGRKVRVVGICYTFENMGNIVLTSRNTFLDIVETGQYNRFFLVHCRDKNMQEVLKTKAEIVDYLKQSNVPFYTETVSEMYEANNNKNEKIIEIIIVLCFFSLLKFDELVLC